MRPNIQLLMRVGNLREGFIARRVVCPRIDRLHDVGDIQESIVVIVRRRHLKSEGKSRGGHTEREGEGGVTGDVLHRRRIDLGR